MISIPTKLTLTLGTAALVIAAVSVWRNAERRSGYVEGFEAATEVASREHLNHLQVVYDSTDARADSMAKEAADSAAQTARAIERVRASVLAGRNEIRVSLTPEKYLADSLATLDFVRVDSEDDSLTFLAERKGVNLIQWYDSTVHKVLVPALENAGREIARQKASGEAQALARQSAEDMIRAQTERIAVLTKQAAKGKARSRWGLGASCGITSDGRPGCAAGLTYAVR